MGAPTLRWQEADATTHLAYAQGPMGFKTLVVIFAPDGRLRSIDNTLDAKHFAAIKPGLTEEQVLHLLGPPQPQWTTDFKARDELVWEWRFCDDWNEAARFDVVFAAAQGTVTSTFEHREDCGLTGCLCAH